jgi:hypothetical protein
MSEEARAIELLDEILRAAAAAHTDCDLGSRVHAILSREKYEGWVQDPTGAIWRD